MTDPSGRWARVTDLLGQALDLTAADRDAFLDEACGEDHALRAELATLVGAATSSDEYFDDLAKRAGLPGSQGQPLKRLTGRRLGHWRLGRVLGTGGMGVVYLAERDDDQMEMRAALKILRVGAVTEDAHHRFLAERQMLGRLQHPNIARLVDGGVTDDGTPYYVMEFVDGIAIDRYCDGRRMSVRERIALFLQVCAAVTHAHRNLIVHRDLKPGNILVTEAGEVKLLDFGIARMLHPTETMLDASAVYGHPMTVAYASPEQLLGGDITTATDVYALGLLLYELLAGVHPYRHALTSSAEAERLICETPPSAPSATLARLRTGRRRLDSDPSPGDVARARAMPQDRLQRALAGDLDTIVLMALRKEPERRYQSAAELADDLHRYLERRPVSARPDTLAYRASRFVLRNRVAAGAGAAVALLLVALVTVAIWTAVVTTRQARVIEREGRAATEMSTFLVDLFRQADPIAGYGDTVRARTLLDEGSRRLRERLDDQPEVRARLLTTLADVYGNLGLYDDAQALRREAIEAYQVLHGGPHLDVADQLTRLAYDFKSDRVPDSAVAYFRAALAMRRALNDTPLGIAGPLAGLAGALRDAGYPDSAVPLLEQALAARGELLGVDALPTASVMGELAMTMRALNRPDSAERLYGRILGLAAVHSDSGRRLRSATLNNLAYLHRGRNDLEAADSLYRASLALERQLGNTVTLLTVLVNLASIAYARGDTAETRALLEERIAVARAAWPAGHWRTGAALNALAIHYMRDRDDCAGAIPLLEEQVDVYARTLGPDHRWTAAGWSGLGNCLRREGQFSAAERALLTAVETQRAFGVEDDETQRTLRALAELYTDWGRPADAARLRADLMR